MLHTFLCLLGYGIQTNTYPVTSLCSYVFVLVCLNILYVQEGTKTRVCVCVCVRARTLVYVCVYIYICMYVCKCINFSSREGKGDEAKSEDNI